MAGENASAHLVTYPEVVGEFGTIAAVASGMNLARLGDGELKIAHGFGYNREPANRALTDEIRHVISGAHPNCAVGIPTMDPDGPKYTNWMRHEGRFLSVLADGLTYYSAFVSRPDSAPWIESKLYGSLVQDLWLGKKTVVVCERQGSMLCAVKPAALSLTHIECPSELAYSVIDDLERRVIEAAPEIAILSAGPTATCLANRLARVGIHAVDLGSAGKFIRRLIA
jgi:hypothetical protein